VRWVERVTAVVTGAALLGALTACGEDQRELMATPEPMTPPPATLVHISDVRTGMCLDADRLPAGGRTAYLEAVDCSQQHTGEVFAVVEDSSDPSAAVPNGARCWEEYATYVGIDPEHSRNTVRALTATAEAAAERSAPLVCITVTPDRMAGSVRGTAS
jgi:hypothetical protein